MIHRASIVDLPSLVPLAEKFASQENVVLGVDPDWWLSKWGRLIERGAGAIFYMLEGDRPIGGIGGLVYQGLNTPALQAKEAFWFMDPKHRGKGTLLLQTFENWAKSEGAEKVWMVRLGGDRGKLMDRYYERQGYVPAERAFYKEVI